ncbi:DUF1768-domain-containing protein [Whalleya microplaca]|nr:DUF1768-domain-containing protein [Whalleya microplaca]
MSSKQKKTHKSTSSPASTSQPTSTSAPTTTPTSQPTLTDETIYFWRPSHATTGYLSQWYPQAFRDRTDPRKVYATAEHYMMHQKALLFGDADTAAVILAAEDPATAKALGRRVERFDEAVWKHERRRIDDGGDGDGEAGKGVARDNESGSGNASARKKTVWKLGTAADAQELEAARFRDVLLATGDRELVEASPYDRIWGVGFRPQDAGRNRKRWGLNLLGKCLMEVREQFRREDEEMLEAVGK